MTRRALARVVVAGGGPVALLAAVALKRALPAANVELIALPVSPAAFADTAATTLPALAQLHARLGIDERGLLIRAGASHRLATCYRGWGPAGADFSVGFGATIPPSAFRAAWGLADDRPAAAVPAVALAAAEQFVPPSDDPASPLSDLDYALRFVPSAYVAHLRMLAAHLGISTIEAQTIAVEREAPESIAAVVAAGCRFAADLYIDASGPVAVLAPDDAEQVSWAAYTPVDHVALAAPLPPAISVTDTAERRGTGYLLRCPGRDATRVLLGFEAAAVADPAALLGPAGCMLDKISPVVAGRAAAAWGGNRIALGDAAAHFEPLASTNLHLAVLQIGLLLDLLPGLPLLAAERREYNRRAALLADRTFDYVAAHHALVATARQPALDRRIDLFARRGLLERRGEEGISPDLWRQLLAGLGLAAAEPRVAALPPAARAAAAAGQARRVAAVLAAAEPYPAFLARTLAAQP